MISWAITACNEHEELKRLLEQIESIKKDGDEIIIQLDTNFTEEVKKVTSKYNPIITSLKGDFANFKNILKKHCTKDYIFFLDADEYLSPEYQIIHDLLKLNHGIDCWALPRINTVKGIGDRPDLIQKWGWNINSNGWINYPDYQLRICKNIPEIQWVGKVHERLTGYTELTELPDSDWSILHPKQLERQIKQNELYSKL